MRQLRLCPRQQKVTAPSKHAHWHASMLCGGPSSGCGGCKIEARPMQALEVGGELNVLAPPQELRALQHKLQRIARMRRTREDCHRVWVWQQWRTDSWSGDQGSIYWWLCGDHYNPLVFIVRLDNMATTNVQKMHTLVGRPRHPSTGSMW